MKVRVGLATGERWASADGRFAAPTPALDDGATMEPVRTCLGCRVRADKSDLLRVVARDGEVVADQSATLPGRGAWVHPTPACVEKANTRKAFGRALRVTGLLDAGQVIATVTQQAKPVAQPRHHQTKAD